MATQPVTAVDVLVACDEVEALRERALVSEIRRQVRRPAHQRHWRLWAWALVAVVLLIVKII